jgi:hypothetical protein
VNEQTKEQLEKEYLQRKQEILDLQEILKTDAGMRFFKKLFERGYMYSSTFTGNSRGYFLEGKRMVCLELLHDIAIAAPEKVSSLMVDFEQAKKEFNEIIEFKIKEEEEDENE